MSVCYVTAYLEIGREQWVHFKRTFEEYFSAFLKFLEVFSKNTENNSLIIFIDKLYFEKVQEKVKNISNVNIISIDEEYMKNNSLLWNRMESEEKIMKSERYISLISHRSHCPETHNPKYTLINHAKVDFMKLGVDMNKSEYFCWVDFGYCSVEDRIPRSLLDIEKLDKKRINYTLINPIDSRDTNPIYTLIYAPERFGGFFFFGNRDIILDYQKLYHKVHLDFQNLGLVDDDQHIAMRCYFENSDMFSLYNLGGWHKALRFFEKD